MLRALFLLVAAISVVTWIGYDWPLPWFFNGSTLHMLLVIGVMIFALYTVRLAYKQRGIWGYSHQRWIVGAILSTVVFFAWIQWFTTSTHWQCPPYWVGNDCPDESRLAVLHPTIRAAFPVGWWSLCLFLLSLGQWRDLRVELKQWWLTLLSLLALLLLGWVVG